MPMNTQEHTSKRYDTELETVRSRVLQMGGLVETQITAAIEALSTGNVALADQVVLDDHRVNALEVRIDEDRLEFTLRSRQPPLREIAAGEKKGNLAYEVFARKLFFRFEPLDARISLHESAAGRALRRV